LLFWSQQGKNLAPESGVSNEEFGTHGGLLDQERSSSSLVKGSRGQYDTQLLPGGGCLLAQRSARLAVGQHQSRNLGLLISGEFQQLRPVIQKLPVVLSGIRTAAG
jgi:hypothetical protein